MSRAHFGGTVAWPVATHLATAWTVKYIVKCLLWSCGPPPGYWGLGQKRVKASEVSTRADGAAMEGYCYLGTIGGIRR